MSQENRREPWPPRNDPKWLTQRVLERFLKKKGPDAGEFVKQFGAKAQFGTPAKRRSRLAVA